MFSQSPLGGFLCSVIWGALHDEERPMMNSDSCLRQNAGGEAPADCGQHGLGILFCPAHALPPSVTPGRKQLQICFWAGVGGFLIAPH